MIECTIRIKRIKGGGFEVWIKPVTGVEIPKQTFPTMEKATSYVTGFLRKST